jgi:hypothetical protein
VTYKAAAIPGETVIAYGRADRRIGELCSEVCSMRNWTD